MAEHAASNSPSSVAGVAVDSTSTFATAIAQSSLVNFPSWRREAKCVAHGLLGLSISVFVNRWDLRVQALVLPEST